MLKRSCYSKPATVIPVPLASIISRSITTQSINHQQQRQHAYYYLYDSAPDPSRLAKAYKKKRCCARRLLANSLSFTAQFVSPQNKTQHTPLLPVKETARQWLIASPKVYEVVDVKWCTMRSGARRWRNHVKNKNEIRTIERTKNEGGCS